MRVVFLLRRENRFRFVDYLRELLGDVCDRTNTFPSSISIFKGKCNGIALIASCRLLQLLFTSRTGAVHRTTKQFTKLRKLLQNTRFLYRPL
jgi:hypothetical protein